MQPAREHLSERHYRSIVELIEGRVGIQLPAAKRTMVEGRLRRRLRALSLDGLGAYGRYVFDEGNLEAEFVHLVDCVTTNKTDFFREPAHFEFLRDQIRAWAAGRDRGRPVGLKLWSAAASTGAEAYTVAMVIDDLVRQGVPLTYAILATDISTEVLATARAGIYPVEMLDQIPPSFRRRYVMEARNPARPVGRIAPELRRRVNVLRLNLMDESYPVDRDVDVVFCRNVLIYFDKPTQRQVIGRLADHLRPGGILIVGHSESMAGAGVGGLRQLSPTVFGK
ncbi:MAG: chemotaxis protein CheR [Methylorubrum populi]